MIVNNVSLEAVAVAPKQYPVSGLPEIAFVGRSNVGKSSLINCMINRKALARTSGNPGKTRTINFYNVENALYFVDLPGYGYAKTSRAESEKWGKMIEAYLLKREELKCIIMLVDIRHEPMKNDVSMFEWLRYYNYNMAVAATKCDKINRSQIQKNLSVIRGRLNLTPEETIIPFSSESKKGRDELWGFIDEILMSDKLISDL